MSWASMERFKHSGGMGFQDLEVFNLALLAKQGWLIIQFPDSLVAKIMREMYFPNRTFLSAQVGRRHSYAWMSICQARKVLEVGLVWRVGNGEQIHIWGDKWLLTPSTYKIQSPVRVLASNAESQPSLTTTQIGGISSLFDPSSTRLKPKTYAVWCLAHSDNRTKWYGWALLMAYSWSKVPITWRRQEGNNRLVSVQLLWTYVTFGSPNGTYRFQQW
jgi:hypothetical protein